MTHSFCDSRSISCSGACSWMREVRTGRKLFASCTLFHGTQLYTELVVIGYRIVDVHCDKSRPSSFEASSADNFTYGMPWQRFHPASFPMTFEKFSRTRAHIRPLSSLQR